MRTSSQQRRDSGFSFIELLAYMTIAALLILAAIPQLNHHRQKASLSNLENDAHSASLAAQAVQTDGSNDGADLASIQAAVDRIDRAADTTVTVTPVGRSDYRITATNPKAEPYSVVYATSTAKDRGATFNPGLQLVRDGKIVGCPSCNVSDESSLSEDDGWKNYGIGVVADNRYVITFAGTTDAFSDFGEVTGIPLTGTQTGTVAPSATIDGTQYSSASHPAVWTMTSVISGDGSTLRRLQITVENPRIGDSIMSSRSITFANGSEGNAAPRLFTFNWPGR